MSRRGTTWLTWSLFAADVATVACLFVLSPQPAGLGSSVAGAVFVLTFATTGAMVATRRPGNPVGWLLCSSALAFSVGAVCEGVSEYAYRERRDDLLVAQSAAWVGLWVWMVGVGLAATFLLLLFPDGRLPSARWRPVAWLAGGSLGVSLVALMLVPGRIEDTRIDNPFGVSGIEALLEALVAGGLALLFVSILASCFSLVARFRSADSEQRQQLKWIAYSLPVVVGMIAASALAETALSGDAAVELANMLVSLGLAVVPVAIGIAILRHRLFDIDVVINRTLVYAGLSATLAVVYLGSVLVLQRVLSPLTEQSDLAVAASTLAVAAVFRPARARIQSVVDRRFYRARYDAARTLESFTARLRHEVDLESVSADLQGVVRETVHPAHVSLWMRSAP